MNWNFGFLLILDVRNVLNKCSAEKPCEVNAGDCSIDNECRGNLICTRNNCEGSTFSLYAKCCQERGEVFGLEIIRNWWIFSLSILIICKLHISKKKQLLKHLESSLQKRIADSIFPTLSANITIWPHPSTSTFCWVSIGLGSNVIDGTFLIFFQMQK